MSMRRVYTLPGGGTNMPIWGGVIPCQGERLTYGYVCLWGGGLVYW